MAVNGTEYRMWAGLAQRKDLPDAALAAVVDGLLPGDGRFEPGWQEDVFKGTLTSLFHRVGDQELRERLIAAASNRIPELVRRGVLGSRDVPAVLRHHPVDGELLAALARHDAHREVVTGLVEAMNSEHLFEVVLSAERPRHDDPNLLPGVPEWLLDAVVRRGLSLVAAELNAFAAVNAQAAQGRYWWPSGWPAYGSVALVLERCPQWWPELAEDNAYGPSFQHLLLDCMDTEKITDEVLASCVPALVLPEWAELPAPERTQRQRLRHIGQRVARHPRLRETAAAHLHDAAAHCVKQGRLLHATKLRRLRPHEVMSLARDLALTSSDTKSLTKLWDVVAQLPQPTAVVRPSKYDGDEPPSPKLLLSDDSRVSALAALACNPHLERRLVTELLDHLHPVEVRWLATYKDAVPAWLKEAAVAHTASSSQQEEVARVLTDEELDSCADPEAVMQTWLDAVQDHRGAFFDQVEYAVLNSRHRTDTLVRRIHAHIVLSHYEQPVAADTLMLMCGSNPDRWQAVAEALTSKPDFEETFGQFIDRMNAGSA